MLAGASARIDAIERAQRSLPARLPEAIGRADATRIGEALARPVTQALGSAVRENRQLIVDVLFPVIGPAIRKAIAEALRTLVADVNGAIESSFTLKGLAWRIESIRGGVPYAEIVLKHTLKYRVDHVFLIERDSGLVLDRESAPALPDLDADAIAGMLTAIGDFVGDSVGRDGGTLESARVGEHLLWVLQGPRANLACFIRGVPPAELHARLQRALEDIHARLGSGDAALDASARALLNPAALERAEAGAAAPRTSRRPLIALLLAALALGAWLFWRGERWNVEVAALRARLEAHPGFVLTGIDERGEALGVRGLIDADAEPLDLSMASGAPVTLETAGYVSTDDAIVARRARRLLAAPANIAIAVEDGALSVSGRASQAWIDRAREQASWIPGVRSVEIVATAETDAVANARAELEALASALPARRVRFMRETEPEAGTEALLDEISADAHRAIRLARAAGVAIAWTAVGANDDPGGAAINARVRADRARWLAAALAARGIAAVAIDGTEAELPRERAAYLRLAIGAEAQ